MPPEVPDAKRTKKRRLIVATVLAAILVGSGFLVWEVIRARSIAEVLASDHWQAGSTVSVAGTITSIDRENTSYGSHVYLGLDHDSECGSGCVLGDPNATYAIGEPFQTILHFQAYSINGDPAVWAPELAWPFPRNFEAIATVIDSVSLVREILLVYNGTAANGTRHYEIVTENGNAYRADKLPVTLRKSLPIWGSNPRLAGSPVDSAARWNLLASVQYLEASGGFTDSPIVDRMSSLAQGTSANRTLRFVDANRDGLLDDGDRLDVNLPATGSPAGWDAYMLQIGGVLSLPQTYAGGVHFFLNGPKGPFEVPRSARKTPLLHLRYVGDQVGAGVTSTMEVSDVPFGTAPSLSRLGFSLTVGSALSSGNLTDLPATLGNGASLSLTDANGDGRLDSRDFFRVGNLVNHSSVSLSLREGNVSVGFASWIVGYGQPVGTIPLLTLTVQGVNPWRAMANLSFWSPELALSRTLRASLLENGIAVLTNLSLVNGTLGTFANGTLAFTDADGDGTLSTGDSFTVTGSPGHSYELDVAWLYRAPLRVFL